MNIRQMMRCALFAALTAVGAFFKIPFPLAAISLQFLFTAMAGLLLGAKYGAISQAVYVLVGLCGAPVFSLGGGFGYIFEPTFGFVLGLIPGAYVAGKAAKRPLTARAAIWAASLALLAVYAVGLGYLALIANGYLGKGLSLRQIMMSGMLIYLPGDCVKIAAAGILCPAIARRMPGALQ